MNIKINMVPSETSNTKTVSLEDLGITEKEWSEMSADDREERINNYLCELPEQPYWMVDTFRED